MLLRKLQLTNFRNYSKFDLDFTDRPTIFIGPNGAGKSNILEAIYFLSTTKSPRVEQELELIKNGEQATSIKGLAQEKKETEELLITIVSDEEGQRKRVAINGVGKRVVDFIGYLPAVIFWPTDINMVTGSPSLRRWHLDLSLVQVDRTYKKSLTAYGEVLVSRNKVLKRIREGEGRVDELTYWTEELVREGKIISQKREEFFEFINQHKSELGNFQFEYHPSIITWEKLQSYQEREIAAANTLIGPHRDDFKFVILNKVKDLSRMRVSNELRDPSSKTPQDDFGRDLSRFGSRGEQRMVTLAFKLATLEYMAKVLGKRPILLLDDVFSELDSQHRAAVSKISTLQQTIIATVELENIPKEFLDSSRILQVTDGVVHLSS